MLDSGVGHVAACAELIQMGLSRQRLDGAIARRRSQEVHILEQVTLRQMRHSSVRNVLLPADFELSQFTQVTQDAQPLVGDLAFPAVDVELAKLRHLREMGESGIGELQRSAQVKAGHAVELRQALQRRIGHPSAGVQRAEAALPHDVENDIPRLVGKHRAGLDRVVFPVDSIVGLSSGADELGPRRDAVLPGDEQLGILCGQAAGGRLGDPAQLLIELRPKDLGGERRAGLDESGAVDFVKPGQCSGIATAGIDQIMGELAVLFRQRRLRGREVVFELRPRLESMLARQRELGVGEGGVFTIQALFGRPIAGPPGAKKLSGLFAQLFERGARGQAGNEIGHKDLLFGPAHVRTPGSKEDQTDQRILSNTGGLGPFPRTCSARRAS